MRTEGAVFRETPTQGEAQAVVVRVATEREAKAATLEVKEKFGSMQTAWFELGKMVRDSLNRQVPAALEMTAIDWLKDCVGESVSKVYRSLRIVKALEGLPQSEVQKLTEGKAYQLTRLQPKEREEWIVRALDEDNKAFEQSVDAHIHKKTGLATEPRTIVSVSLEASVAELWKSAEEKIARIGELDIETTPGLRARVFEYIAILIDQTEEVILRAEMMGDDGSEVPLT